MSHKRRSWVDAASGIVTLVVGQETNPTLYGFGGRGGLATRPPWITPALRRYVGVAATMEAALQAALQGLSVRICLIDMGLQDSCKRLRRLQELSVLTRSAPQATLPVSGLRF